MEYEDKIIKAGKEDIEVLADSISKHLASLDTIEEKEKYLNFFDSPMFTYLLIRKIYEKNA